MSKRRRRFHALTLLSVLLLGCGGSWAYSVLTHEQVVDLLWGDVIEPLLKTRYPGLTEEQLKEAHAYAYGGAVIQDLGYYPFGSADFSNLVHYVRSGDFVEALLHEAHDVNEYAFTLYGRYFRASYRKPGRRNRISQAQEEIWELGEIRSEQNCPHKNRIRFRHGASCQESLCVGAVP